MAALDGAANACEDALGDSVLTDIGSGDLEPNSFNDQAELAEAPLLFESGGEGGDAIGDGAPHVSVGSACQNGGGAPPDALGQAIVPWQPS